MRRFFRACLIVAGVLAFVVLSLGDTSAPAWLGDLLAVVTCVVGIIGLIGCVKLRMD